MGVIQKPKDGGRFFLNVFLWHLSEYGGHLLRKPSLNCISEYYFLQIIVNQEQMKKCCLKKNSLFVTENKPSALLYRGERGRGCTATVVQPTTQWQISKELLPLCRNGVLISAKKTKNGIIITKIQLGKLWKWMKIRSEIDFIPLEQYFSLKMVIAY